MPVHRVKRIDFLGRTVPVLLQNENGPCPLLAICNGLLLRGSITLPAGRMEVVTDELVQLVANRLFEGNAAALTSSTQAVAANAQKSVDDVIAILPDFAVGLDVNVRFDKVDSFEFTRQLATFDLTGMRLLHGWTYDPQDVRVASVVGKLSYNQLIERLINLRSATTATEGKQPVMTSSSSSSSAAAAAPAAGGGRAGQSTGVNTTLHDDIALGRVSEPHEATLVTESKTGEPAGVATVVATTTTAGDPDGSTGRKGPAAAAAAGGKSADPDVANAVDVIIAGRSRSESEHAQDFATLAALEDFLDGTRTQLSYHGLAELHAFVRENELAVFFRNNHFSTLFKHEGQLYLLLTDIGYEHQPAHVWERLTEIDGDTCCCDSTFRRSPAVSATPPRSAASAGGKVDADYLLAMQLQHGSGGGGGGGGEGSAAVVTGTVLGVGDSGAAGSGGARQVATAAVVTPSAAQNGWVQGADVAAQQRELARLKREHTERRRQEETRAAQKKKKKGGCTIM